MPARVIAFPGVTIISPPSKPPATRRERYLRRLADQARAGDVGANAELRAVCIRDAAVASQAPWPPLFYHDRLIGGIRKLRRQLEGLGKEGA